jgi:myo-inositol 2-dehydrogenase / D-chiro-inositol 1-dehydrogenase
MTPPAGTTPGRPIRVGVAGLGAVAQAVHLPLLAQLDSTFEIAAVADLSIDLRTAIGERYRVPVDARHGSVADLLAQDGLDAVVLLTSGSHGGDALAALGRGFAVLCEKPLATTLAEADALARDPRADRLLLGYMKAYDPAVEEAARISREDATALGQLRSIDVHVLHPTSEAQLAFAHLRPPAGDIDPAKLAGLNAAAEALVVAALGVEAAGQLGRLYAGIVLGSIVHELSVIRAVTGNGDPLEIDHVDVWPDGVWPPSVEVAGRLTSGARVTIGWHFLDRYPAYREEVRFHHPGGSVELTFPAPYRLHEPTILQVETGGAETRRRMVFDSIEEAFERELVAFAGLVRDGGRPATGIADGRTDTVTSQRIIAALARARGIPVGGEAATS